MNQFPVHDQTFPFLRDTRNASLPIYPLSYFIHFDTLYGMPAPSVKNSLLYFAAAFLLTMPLHADIVLTSFTDNITVGLDDTDSNVLPSPEGDGWFTGAHAGTVRQRTTGNQEQRRTQWYFRFDISTLSAVAPGDITGASLSLPQVGRLNNLTGSSQLKVFDPNNDWDDDGGNYPVWNLGRETNGGTQLINYGATSYQTFGTTADTGNASVEGTFLVDNALLLATVQSWASNPTNNEGILVTMTSTSLSGLAFGAPTLTISTVPEPATLGLFLCGLLVLRRSVHSPSRT